MLVIKKTRLHSSKHSRIPKGKNKEKRVIMVEKDKIEYLLLFNTLLNYYILLVTNKLPTKTRLLKLEELFRQLQDNDKLISRKTSDLQIKNLVSYLDTFFGQLLILLKQSIKKLKLKKLALNDTNMNEVNYTNMNEKINKKTKINTKPTKPTKPTNSNHRGGFYFKTLEEKGETPITGADLTRLLDEMQQFFYNAKYTEEGKFLQDTDTLLSLLRGDVQQFKAILQYRIFPQFYNAYPPFIKWDEIYTELIGKRRWEDLPDYLLAYQSYLRSRDEYMVEKGLKPPSVLQKDLYTGFFNKISNSINDNMYAFQQARNKFQGKFFPVTLPS
jgi:hypothetical protein